jgi:putative endonuclease
MDKMPCVYTLASKPRGTLYVGMSRNLRARILAHRDGSLDGFTKKYGVRTLVYVESHSSVADAFAREKRLKRWRRQWKLDLIETLNPNWRDLAEEWW